MNNAVPRDHTSQAGAYDATLQDRQRMTNVEQPLEVLRTIHSFEPCVACTVHVSNGEQQLALKVPV